MVLRVDWTPELRRVNNQFPIAIRSKNWPEIVRLANSGQVDKAKELAALGLRNPDVLRRTAVGRRMRIERVALFSRLALGKRDLRDIFSVMGERLGKVVLRKADSQKNIPFINDRVDEIAVELRREIKKWVNRLARDSTRLGLRNSGAALLPIFKANREVSETLQQEMDILQREQLLEARLTFGLKTSFANSTDPTVKIASKKWAGVMTRVMRQITKSTTAGLKLSDRVFEITQRTKQDLKRIITNSVAQGESSQRIARKVRRYLSPANIDRAELGIALPPGVYRSPFRNAMRLARTETNRAYTHASAEFAKGKSWITGMQITLSSIHSHTDICDQWAGKVVSPDRFQELVPFHPHCMCYSTFVLKDDVLADEESVAA